MFSLARSCWFLTKCWFVGFVETVRTLWLFTKGLCAGLRVHKVFTIISSEELQQSHTEVSIIVWLPSLRTLPSKSSFLIMAWVSGFSKSSFICFTLDFSSILSRCKASLIKSWIPTGFLPKGKKLYNTFKVQISMKYIKYGTLTYQNKAEKPLKCYPHFIEKIAFCQKYIIYMKLNLLQIKIMVRVQWGQMWNIVDSLHTWSFQQWQTELSTW